MQDYSTFLCESIIQRRCWDQENLIMKLPEKGFKFNCGFDICTFPIQYCDTEDKRCGYCSEDICHSDLIPPQCEAECNCK